MIDSKVIKRKPFQVRVHLTDMTRVKGKKWSNFIGCRETFDFARLNENFTALFCKNNFRCGTEFTKRKIYQKRLHRCWGDGNKMNSVKAAENERSPSYKVADRKLRRCVYKLENMASFSHATTSE